MSESTDQAAAHVNSSGPEDQAAAAAAAPCGCEGRIDGLEAQLGRTDRVIRVLGQLSIVCALGMLYLLWVNWPKGD